MRTQLGLLVSILIGMLLLTLLAPGLAEDNADIKAPLGAENFYPSPERPFGWRGDGTGRFPGAKPPTEWRRLANTALKDLKCRAARPGKSEKDGPSLGCSDGFLFDWLVIGPIRVDNPAEAFDQEQIPNESSIEPNTGDKIGDLQWKALKINDQLAAADFVREYKTALKKDPSREEIAERSGASYARVGVPLFPGSTSHVAYAHTYVYSPVDQQLPMRFWHTMGGLKVWLNGKQVYGSKSCAPNKWRWPPPSGVFTNVSLLKGWNRILVKSARSASCMNTYLDSYQHWKPETCPWWFVLTFCPPKSISGYETVNIKWMTKLPTHAWSSPIIAGDRIFVAGEPMDIACLDRKDGRILWIQSGNFYDAIDRKERESLICLQLAPAGIEGKTLKLASNRKLDPASAGKIESYEIAGATLEKAELSANGRVIRLVAKDPWKPGAEVALKLKGIKSAEGREAPAEMKFKALPGRPATGLIERFLIGELRKNIKSVEVVKQDILGEKTLDPVAGDKWKSAQSESGIFDCGDFAGGQYDDAIIYAYTRIFSDEERTAQLLVGSDDTIRVVVNGEPVHVSTTLHPLAVDQDKIPNVKLKKGWNSLLLGVANETYGWQFCARIADSDGKPMPGVAYVSGEEEMSDDEYISDIAADTLVKLEKLAAELKLQNNLAARQINGVIDSGGFAHGVDPAILEKINQTLFRRRAIQDRINGLMNRIDAKKYSYGYQRWGLSSPTPVTDGKNVYTWFSMLTASCYDMDGNRQWTIVPPFRKWSGHHGCHASPVLVDGKFIVPDLALMAFDGKTGDMLWHNKMIDPTYTVPSLITTKIGGENVVFVYDTPAEKSMAYRVKDGKPMWTWGVRAMGADCSSMIIENGLLYRIGSGYHVTRLPDTLEEGKGSTVVKTLVAGNMMERMGVNVGGVPSPLYFDGLIYLPLRYGTLRLYDAIQHEPLYEKDMDMRARDCFVVTVGVSASPVLAGKHIYTMDNSGITVVIQPGREHKPVARNIIENIRDTDLDDWWYARQEEFYASPVCQGAEMYVRGQGWLYCISSDK